MSDVFLSAGHGGSDPGATAYGLKEKDINLNIMLACRDELKRHGVSVTCSRTKDENDPVTDEVKEANKSGAKVAVSFHTNAGKGDGSESYYFKGSSDGKKLAELCEKYTKQIGQNSRGAKATTSLWFIRGTKMTAVLCECAFIDHNTDNNIIDTVAEQKKFGVQYAKAILEYLGIKYQSGSSSSSSGSSSSSSSSFLIKVSGVSKGDVLNIRASASVSAKITGKLAYNDPKKYTIVQTKKVGTETWGKLKSGIGWINLRYTKRV